MLSGLLRERTAKEERPRCRHREGSAGHWPGPLCMAQEDGIQGRAAPGASSQGSAPPALRSSAPVLSYPIRQTPPSPSPTPTLARPPSASPLGNPYAPGSNPHWRQPPKPQTRLCPKLPPHPSPQGLPHPCPAFILSTLLSNVLSPKSQPGLLPSGSRVPAGGRGAPLRRSHTVCRQRARPRA